MAPRTDVFAGGWHFGWWLDKTRQELYHWVEPIIPDLDRSGQAWMVTVMFGVVDDLRGSLEFRTERFVRHSDSDSEAWTISHAAKEV